MHTHRRGKGCGAIPLSKGRWKEGDPVFQELIGGWLLVGGWWLLVVVVVVVVDVKKWQNSTKNTHLQVGLVSTWTCIMFLFVKFWDIILNFLGVKAKTPRNYSWTTHLGSWKAHHQSDWPVSWWYLPYYILYIYISHTSAVNSHWRSIVSNIWGDAKTMDLLHQALPTVGLQWWSSFSNIQISYIQIRVM